MLMPFSGKKSPLVSYDETRPYLGAYVRIHFYYESKRDIEAVLRRCWDKVEAVHRHMNVHATTLEGDLSRLNAGGLSGVRVNPDVYQIIKNSLAYSRKTQGAYDITVFPLIEQWKKAAAKGRMPDKNDLEAAKEKVGYQNLRLEAPDRVFFQKPGMKIDLGSPASGFVCDEIAKILSSNKIQHFLLDGGGEIFCRGKDQGIKPWVIGIQDPFNKDKLHSIVHLQDKGISTSGSYEKFYRIGTETFSHIIDPVSGYPQKFVVSASAMAPTTEAANQLSTAFSVLGARQAMRLASVLNDVEALVIENHEGIITQYQTAGFR
ncbi:MAG: FAD:protein FMN transferase [Candidatus Omnitrophica bacterium]|nr:FAD:protein FMN transferase [Candidatus Omnitrophota bacterium]